MLRKLILFVVWAWVGVRMMFIEIYEVLASIYFKIVFPTILLAVHFGAVVMP